MMAEMPRIASSVDANSAACGAASVPASRVKGRTIRPLPQPAMESSPINSAAGSRCETDFMGRREFDTPTGMVGRTFLAVVL